MSEMETNPIGKKMPKTLTVKQLKKTINREVKTTKNLFFSFLLSHHRQFGIYDFIPKVIRLADFFSGLKRKNFSRLLFAG